MRGHGCGTGRETEKMNRKRFIKKLMGMGLSRNEARQTAAEMLERNSELMHENRLRREITERIYVATGVWNVGYRAMPYSYREWLAMTPWRERKKLHYNI
jgi:hypothetical protein